MNKTATYGLHSTFDLKQHQQTFINYLEVIILPSGEIVYAVPSHTEKLIQLTGESREVIGDKMPIDASPIHWLTTYTGCICVWSDFYIGVPQSAKQQHALEQLMVAGLTKHT